MTNEKDEKKKDQSARDIAEIMVENMKANMADPDFWDKKERIHQEAVDEVLRNRKLREKKKNEI